MTVKDDTPGFYLNKEMHPNNSNPRTLPAGYDYEIPLSLNAETCLSEFRNVEKVPASIPPSPLASSRSKNGGKGNSSSTNVVTVSLNKDEEAAQDTSDLLYNAY